MNTKNQYLLLFSGSEWYNQLSAAEIQNVIDQNKIWFEQLASAGKVKGGQALARSGATISGKNARVVSDGPFAETKEAIGGYMMLEADSMEEVIAIAKENPALRHGTTIEIRPLSGECLLDVRARQLGCKGSLAELQVATA
jgi:hypothetical protein